MSRFSEAVRRTVVERADSRCEYCRLPQRGQVSTFPIDHIIALAHGGHDTLENLALACPHCNSHKWKSIEGFDDVTRSPSPLFHPRTQAWEEHFTWSQTDPSALLGLSPCGRVTITVCRMNDEDMIDVRRLLRELGIFDK